MRDFANTTTVRVEPEPAKEASRHHDATADWSILFLAISEKLRNSVGVPRGIAHAPQLGDASERTRADVLECARAVDQLHALLEAQFGSAVQPAAIDNAPTSGADQMGLVSLNQTAVLTAQHGVRSQLLPNGLVGDLAAPAVAAGFTGDGVNWLADEHFFLKQVDQALRKPASMDKALTVLLVDIEGLQCIRTRYGQTVTNRVLTHALSRLINRLPRGDLTCRISEKQFACLLTGGQSRDALTSMLPKLLSALNADYASGQLKLSLQATLGVAFSPGPGASGRLMLANAQSAAHLAAGSPTGCEFFQAGAVQEPLRG